MTDRPDIIIDVRNFVSWVSLLKVTQAFDAMPPASVMEIRGADPETRQDLFKILPAESYRLLAVEDHEAAEICRVRLLKHETQSPPVRPAGGK